MNKVETASIKYIIHNYETNTDADLGKVPKGMEIDSCSINTLQMRSPGNGNNMLNVNDKGRMIFNGSVCKAKFISMLSVYVGFKRIRRKK